jgi:5'-3' exonuclease
MPPDLLAQFPLLEKAVEALGVKVWPMTDLEADDALASAAAVGHDDPAVDQVAIWTPDKDLAQCVRGNRVVQVDRRSGKVIDDVGVKAKFGIPPESIPDYLALVGDSADGFPGLPGWGAKSTATVLAHYGHIEAIPAAAGQWEVGVRNAGSLAAALVEQMEDALLFRDLATLRVDRSLLESGEALGWKGPTDALPAMCERLEAPNLADRVARLAKA